MKKKRLARNEDLTTEYHKTVKQYIDNNHVTKIPPEDLTPEKIYVVYDAAAKYRNCSLNDHCEKQKFENKNCGSFCIFLIFWFL